VAPAPPDAVALLAAMQIALMSATIVSFVVLYAAMMDRCSEGEPPPISPCCKASMPRLRW